MIYDRQRLYISPFPLSDTHQGVLLCLTSFIVIWMASYALHVDDKSWSSIMNLDIFTQVRDLRILSGFLIYVNHLRKTKLP